MSTPTIPNGSEHTFKRFDEELTSLQSLVMRMGGLVQEQLEQAMRATREANLDLAREVIARDHMVNFLDVQADEQVVNMLALRQPMARDLRQIMSLTKAVTDLERIGDEAERVARMCIGLFDAQGGQSAINHVLLRDAYAMADIASAMLRGALDSMARLDVEQAMEVARRDAELDSAFKDALRRLTTYVMEDSRNVGHVVNVTFILKSLERIGDHAKNISEYVVYLVKGKDVRHISPQSVTDEQLDTLLPDSGSPKA